MRHALVALLLLLLVELPRSQTTWWVDAAACPGPGSGTASDPFCSLGDALSAAMTGDTVLVLPGTYFGGFSMNGRDIVLRSEVDGDETTYDPDPDLVALDGGGSSRVLYSQSQTLATVIEGFTIRNGFADHGGGIHCIFSSPTIRGNVIRNCHATGRGGGINSESSSPLIEHNLIEQNSAAGGGTEGGAGGIWLRFSASVVRNNIIRSNTALKGAGIFNSFDATPSFAVIEDNVISRNAAPQGGGGIRCLGARPRIRRNVIADNEAGYYGGGGLLTAGGSFPLVSNNLFVNNRAYGRYGLGGACLIDSGGATSVTFVNDTFVGNTGTGFGGAFFLSSVSQVLATNCVFWNNSAPAGSIAALTGPCVFEVSYSDVPGGMAAFDVPTGTLIWGPGNLDVDPLFVDENGRDGLAATWEDNDYHLLALSPCIDVGDDSSAPADDLDGMPRPVDGNGDGIATTDLGAHEHQRVLLYCVGNATPGGTVTFVVQSTPGSLTHLFAGSSWLVPPLTTPWGLLHVSPPFLGVISLGPIGPSGSIAIDVVVPSLPGGTRIPVQAFVGAQLSNPWTLDIQ